MNTDPLRSKLNRAISKRNHAITTHKEESARLKAATQKEADVLEAQQHLQQLAQSLQQQSHEQICKIVTRCLNTVFGDLYRLRIDFVRLRGKTEARLLYLKEGKEVSPLQTSGGVLDVSSFALRLTQLVLSQPQSRKLLVLDEAFKQVSEKRISQMAKLLETLNRDLGVQIILATHNPSLEIGKVVEL
jgi:DNA repair exonuclease SbcCD ATPase subunit